MHTTPSGTEAAVCADIAERQRLGIAKYGTTVADNPLALREWLQHAYEEALDKAVYLKRAIEEMDKPVWIKEGLPVSVRPNVASGWWYGYVTLVTGDEAYVSVEGTTLPFKMRKDDRGLLWNLTDVANILPADKPSWITAGTPIEVLTDSPLGQNYSPATVRAVGSFAAVVEGPKVGNVHMIYPGGEGRDWRRGAAAALPMDPKDPSWIQV